MKTSYRNLTSLRREVSQSEELLNMIKEKPKEFFENLKFNSPVQRPWIFALIVGIIGLALVTSIIFIGIISLSEPHQTIKQLSNGNKEVGSFIIQIPEIFGVIASSSIAAIAGLLAPSPLRNNIE